MQYFTLGSTGIKVSSLAFGAGPIPELMTFDNVDSQIEVVRRAVDVGINWFDTAATYGNGRSESSLGRALHEIGAVEKVNIATKVRLMPDDDRDIGTRVRESIAGSLERLGVERVTLLQLHNSITKGRGDEPTSVTPDDVLGPGGVLEAFRDLQRNGIVDHIGLTAIGQPEALRQVIQSGEFATIQTPFNVLNPSAGQSMSNTFSETDYGNIIADCDEQNMGVFAIRIFAGGALVGNAPAQHTYRTKFFPLDLYQRDQQRAEQLQTILPSEMSIKEAAVRFVIGHPTVTSAIIGYSEPDHIDQAAEFSNAGDLDSGTRDALKSFQDTAL